MASMLLHWHKRLTGGRFAHSGASVTRIVRLSCRAHLQRIYCIFNRLEEVSAAAGKLAVGVFHGERRKPLDGGLNVAQIEHARRWRRHADELVAHVPSLHIE